MNSAGFRPPPAPIVPAPIVTSEFEEYGQQFTFPTQPINAPISVYTTKQTWSSIDVYMSLPPGSTFQGPFLSELNPSLGVLIYATSRGVRSLVASGRIGLEDEASRGVGPKHVGCLHLAVDGDRVANHVLLPLHGPGQLLDVPVQRFQQLLVLQR